MRLSHEPVNHCFLPPAALSCITAGTKLRSPPVVRLRTVRPIVAAPNVIDQFLERFQASLGAGTFTRLLLSQPVPGGVRPGRVLARLIDLQGAPHLSLTLRYATKDFTRNLPVAEAVPWVREQLGADFRGALLGTTGGDWQLVIPRHGKARLIPHKPATTVVPPREHDQVKVSALAPSAQDWLHGLGLTDAAGRVRPAMADKHRQIGRYVEILGHLAADCGWGAAAGARALSVADMGCGKGYLTFAAWQLFARQLGHQARVLGVETRAELVTAANGTARSIHAGTLEFVRGEIATVTLPPLDGLIALHACNTATDDALRRGIALGAKLIVVSPCCHQEVRPQLGRPEPLAAVLQHGIMAERMAEWVTDGLRALFLEWAGYRTRLMEFVATEHTPKNLLLAAMREREPFTDPTARERVVALKKFFGLERHALDPLLTA